jgi:peptidoglycan hydrolase CwlO-like protein
METQEATILGLFVLVIGAAIKELFGWISKKNIQNSEVRFDNIFKNLDSISKKIDSLEVKVKQISEESEEMYDWHNKSDQDGVKIWYVRQSLENALRDNAKATEAIARNIELQTKLLEEMIQNQRSMSKEQSDMIKDLRNLEKALTDK